MTKKIEKIFNSNIVKNFEEILGGVFAVVMVCIIILNIILRYFVGFIIEWAEELSVISFVWMVFLGSSACYKRGLHIGVDVVTQLLPKKGKYILKLLIHVFLLVLNITLFGLSVVYTIRSKKPTSVMGISYVYVNLGMVLSFFLMSIYSIRFLIRDIRNPTIEEHL